MLFRSQGTQGVAGPVAGTANQVVYKDGSNNPTGSGNLTFDGSNLYVGGNVTIGGTTVLIAASTLTVRDKDIVVGLATTAGGTVISNDTTASHGGIAVASTEGTPLVPFGYGSAINDLPDTYKQIMWVKSGAWTGLNTDAWLFNYGVGIGSTQVPNGVRLAVGGMQVKDNLTTINKLGVSSLSPNGTDFGTTNYVAIADGSGGWGWGAVSSAGAATTTAIAIKDESISKGNATILDFVGDGITATVAGSTATITVNTVQGLQGTQGTQGTQGLQGTQIGRAHV